MSVTDLTEQTTAVILAGGKGTRLGALTRDICKPALPFGAGYRAIDFALSNCVNSGIKRIGVAVQHRRRVLLRHLRDAWQRPFDGTAGPLIEAWSALDRVPFQGYTGTADAVLKNLRGIARTGSRFVLVLAGDHVYKMDYRAMLEQHCRQGADATVAAVEVPAAEARHFGVLSTDTNDWITAFVEKPQCLPPTQGGSVLASMGVYVFTADFLADVLRDLRQAGRPRHDFGQDVLPALIDEAKVAAFRFRAPTGAPGYWRDIGTPTSYWRANLELLSEPPSVLLDDPDWPIGRTPADVPRFSSRFADSDGWHLSEHRSLLGRDVTAHGTVRGCVLFDDVHVGAGSLVEDAVLLPGARIGTECRLRGVIVDHDCNVPDGTVAEGPRKPRASEQAQEPAILTAADFVVPAMRSFAGMGRGEMARPEAVA